MRRTIVVSRHICQFAALLSHPLLTELHNRVEAVMQDTNNLNRHR